MKAQQLPIYRETFELTREIIKVTRNFPRDLKISLGERLRDDCLDMVLGVYRANAARRDRRAIIEGILERVQVVEMTLRLCCDLGLISRGRHGRLVERTDAIGRQAYGWAKASR